MHQTDLSRSIQLAGSLVDITPEAGKVRQIQTEVATFIRRVIIILILADRWLHQQSTCKQQLS